MDLGEGWKVVSRGMFGDVPHVALSGLISGIETVVFTPDPDHSFFASRPAWRHVAQGRLLCYVKGRCPECGATFRPPDRRATAAPVQAVVAIEHESVCSLSDDAVAMLAKAERQ